MVRVAGRPWRPCDTAGACDCGVRPGHRSRNREVARVLRSARKGGGPGQARGEPGPWPGAARDLADATTERRVDRCECHTAVSARAPVVLHALFHVERLGRVLRGSRRPRPCRSSVGRRKARCWVPQKPLRSGSGSAEQRSLRLAARKVRPRGTVSSLRSALRHVALVHDRPPGQRRRRVSVTGS
jgi:hypothetical protein